ncbi:aldehyde dehydrogenase [Tanacetum coccineum]
MKNEEDPHPLPISSSNNKKESIYKFYALAAIILLAFWSMLTGTLTLNFSAGNLNNNNNHILSTTTHDLDLLEMEDKEKVVEHIDVVGVREASVSEIAKMSINFVHVNPPPSELMVRILINIVLIL